MNRELHCPNSTSDMCFIYHAGRIDDFERFRDCARFTIPIGHDFDSLQCCQIEVTSVREFFL